MLQSEPNIVPFLDVLLVLLIIYMLMAQVGWMHLVVPPPHEGAHTPGRSIVLELMPGNGYAVNGAAVSPDSLVSFLTALFADRSEKAIFLAPARSRRYQEVIAAADLARTAGVTVVGVMQAPDRVRPAPGGTPALPAGH